MNRKMLILSACLSIVAVRGAVAAEEVSTKSLPTGQEIHVVRREVAVPASYLSTTVPAGMSLVIPERCYEYDLLLVEQGGASKTLYTIPIADLGKNELKIGVGPGSSPLFDLLACSLDGDTFVFVYKTSTMVIANVVISEAGKPREELVPAARLILRLDDGQYTRSATLSGTAREKTLRLVCLLDLPDKKTGTRTFEFTTDKAWKLMPSADTNGR